MCREVESIDFRLGQIMSASRISLMTRLREFRWRIDEFLFPCPVDIRRSANKQLLLPPTVGLLVAVENNMAHQPNFTGGSVSMEKRLGRLRPAGDT